MIAPENGVAGGGMSCGQLSGLNKAFKKLKIQNDDIIN